MQEPDYPNAIEWLDEFPNLLVTRTFAKIHGLAGLRIGYGICHPDMADLLNRVRQPFNCNSMALAAAEAALADESHVQKSVETNQKGMQQLMVGFDQLGLKYIPSVGNFISVAFDKPAGEIYEALLKQGVIIRPVGVYDMPYHLRATIGTQAQNQRLLDALETILQ